MTHDEQITLVKSTLKGSPNDWQHKVFNLILKIPPGFLISYGHLAHWANLEYGLNLGPRNTAWLRGKLYGILGHDTDIRSTVLLRKATPLLPKITPIHRSSTEISVHSKALTLYRNGLRQH